MNILDDTGVYYTQNRNDLPISERVFFRKAVGKNATSEHFREATVEELESWESYKAERREEYELIDVK
jgi:hypothetical protein